MCRVFRFATRNSSQGTIRLARKGLFYAATVTVVQLPLHCIMVFNFAFGGRDWTAATLAACTVPLAGFLNMIVFMLYRRKMMTGYGRV